jgi:hypothetical protein
VEERMTEGAANSTINRELSALKRMLNIDAKQTPPIVERVPEVLNLNKSNIHSEFPSIILSDNWLALSQKLTIIAIFN